MRYLRTPHKTAQVLLMMADLTAVFGGLAAAVAIAGRAWVGAGFVGVYVATLAGLLYLLGGYDLDELGSAAVPAPLLLAGVATAEFVAYPFLTGNDRDRVLALTALLLSTAVLILAERLLFVRLADLRPRIVLLLSTEAAAARLESIREMLKLHCRVSEVVRIPDRADAAQAVARDIARRLQPDVLVFERSVGGGGAWPDVILEIASEGVVIRGFAEFYASITGRVPIDLVDPAWLEAQYLMASQRTRLGRARRLLDVAVGIGTCVMALPVMLLIAAITVADSGRPVLFSQERLGQFRRPFELRKFRTMIQDAEAGGPQWAGDADPRVTRFGAFLRTTHLDELPQAWNLLRGDMTLIGPRPIRRVFADRLRGLAPLYNARFLLRPGVTGWPQVLGPYGKNEQEQIVKLEMDLYYLIHGTLLDDAYILARTVRKVVGRHEG